jgi:hypothetical protein
LAIGQSGSNFSIDFSNPQKVLAAAASLTLHLALLILLFPDKSGLATIGWPDFAPSLRTLVDVNPERLERLIGAYQFDDGSIYVVRRYAGRLTGHELGQTPVNLFPSSDHELFARDADLLVDFQGINDTIAAMQLGTGETERHAVRVTETQSQRVFAWLDSTENRFRTQTASPESEAAIRSLLVGITEGKPDYSNMSPTLADSIIQQLPGLQQWLTWLGKMKSLKFERVGANGRDEYRGEFAQGPLRIFVRLNEDGRLEQAEFAPG